MRRRRWENGWEHRRAAISPRASALGYPNGALGALMLPGELDVGPGPVVFRGDEGFGCVSAVEVASADAELEALRQGVGELQVQLAAQIFGGIAAGGGEAGGVAEALFFEGSRAAVPGVGRLGQ